MAARHAGTPVLAPEDVAVRDWLSLCFDASEKILPVQVFDGRGGIWARWLWPLRIACVLVGVLLAVVGVCTAAACFGTMAALA